MVKVANVTAIVRYGNGRHKYARMRYAAWMARNLGLRRALSRQK